MNSERIQKAIDAVFERIDRLDPSELKRQIEAHIGGPLSKQLIDSGMFEAREAEAEEFMALASAPTWEITAITGPAETFFSDWSLSSPIHDALLTTWANSTEMPYPVSFSFDAIWGWTAPGLDTVFGQSFLQNPQISESIVPKSEEGQKLMPLPEAA